MTAFEADDGSLDYARRAGIYIDGIEAEIGSRDPVALKTILARKPFVLCCIGQSNAANHGEGRYGPPRHPVYSFNIMDSRAYLAADPLPGATGEDGSPWGRLGDLMVEAGLCRSVLIVSLAVGGSFVAEWGPNGQWGRRLQFGLGRVVRSGIRIDRLLWHQGEAEANCTAMASDEYSRQFHQMLESIRAAGVRAPIHVAQATICTVPTSTGNNAAIRAAQASLVDPAAGILPGPDTDSLGEAFRRDRCHFNVDGLNRHAELWLECLSRSCRPRGMIGRLFHRFR